LLILIPFAMLVLVNLPGFSLLRKSSAGAVLLLAMSVAQAAVVALHPSGFWNGSLGKEFPTFGLSADSLTCVLLVSIAVVVFAATLVAQAMFQGERLRLQFQSVLLIALVGMNGTVLLSDMFSLYVFLEITSVASFVLIAMHKDLAALEGAFKYLILSAVATVLMLTGVSLMMMVAGGTGFAVVKQALANAGGTSVVHIAVAAFLCGLFIKGGLVPFHGWLPAAYSAAPAPVSVFLAGIATKVSGVYALIRLAANVFPHDSAFNQVLMFIGAASIVIGALAALTQSDMKRLLAYSSISQVGYIILGLGCGTPLAIAAAAFHLFNHSIFKTLLFVNAAAVEQRVGTTDMNRLGGLGKRMPFTSITSGIAAMSTAGIPPLSGFWSKLVLVVALWQAQQYTYAGIAILFSVVTLGYLLVMTRRVFFGKVQEEFAQVREASAGIVVSAVVLAAITVLAGLLIPWLLDAFILPVKAIL
jgi:multicomponent Na+:H+ antiporter subunit D